MSKLYLFTTKISDIHSTFHADRCANYYILLPMALRIARVSVIASINLRYFKSKIYCTNPVKCTIILITFCIQIAAHKMK
jgi:hypothetical protein